MHAKLLHQSKEPDEFYQSPLLLLKFRVPAKLSVIFYQEHVQTQSPSFSSLKEICQNLKNCSIFLSARIPEHSSEGLENSAPIESYRRALLKSEVFRENFMSLKNYKSIRVKTVSEIQS